MKHSAQEIYAYSRARKWLYNSRRSNSPIFVVVMLVGMVMIGFMPPEIGAIGIIAALVIVGAADLDNIIRGNPSDLFFKAFGDDQFESLCKYYRQAMNQKGIPPDVYELDMSILAYYRNHRDLLMTYNSILNIQHRASLDFKINKEHEKDVENLQQTELPAVQHGKKPTGIERDTAHDPDDGG